MSKKRNLDNIEDMDESTYELLGSKLSKLATESRSKERFRERRATDRQDSYAPAPKVKRMRERLE
ncbi:MAG: hypothetical protein WD795_03835 [Woeseia sp.]